MKNLKLYLESLLDDEDDLASNDKFIIEEFLKKNYMPPKNGFVINDDNTVDVKGDLILKSKELEYLTNGFFKFNKVDGFFSIELSNIKSLEGGPRIVVKDFLCNWCKNLTSLEGAPEMLGKAGLKNKSTFNCSNCENLKSLKGIPSRSINSTTPTFNIRASHNESLTSIDLDYIKELNGSLYLEMNQNLSSLKGCPQKVYYFSCTSCDGLKDLVGAPKKCNRFNASRCDNLLNLKGCPEVSSFGELSFTSCRRLKSLKGAPKECNTLDISYCNELENFIGAPQKITQVFANFCSGLKTFEGLDEVDVLWCKNCANLGLDVLPSKGIKHFVVGSVKQSLKNELNKLGYSAGEK